MSNALNLRSIPAERLARQRKVLCVCVWETKRLPLVSSIYLIAHELTCESAHSQGWLLIADHMWEEWRGGVLCLFAFHYINWIKAPFAAILFALQAHLPAKMHSVHTHSGEDCVYFHLASAGSKLPNYYGAYRMASYWRPAPPLLGQSF